MTDIRTLMKCDSTYMSHNLDLLTIMWNFKLKFEAVEHKTSVFYLDWIIA